MKDKVEEILKERQLQYGDAEVNFATVGRIWGALMHQDDLSPTEVATFMIAWKMARAFANPSHEDSWHDLAGYVTLATEIASQLWEDAPSVKITSVEEEQLLTKQPKTVGTLIEASLKDSHSVPDWNERQIFKFDGLVWRPINYPRYAAAWHWFYCPTYAGLEE
jgi:hypothetical protein